MTMESGTAVAEPPEVSIPAIEAQPPEIEATEVASVEATDQPDSGDVADGAPVATESAAPDYNSLLADVSDDELAENPKIKSLIARREESVRQKTAAEEQAKLILRDQEWLARDEYIKDFQQAVQLVEDEATGTPKLNLDPKKFQATADKVFSTASRLAMGVLGNEIQKIIPPDFQIPVEHSNALAEARQAYLENPLNSAPLLAAWLKTVGDVAVKASEAEVEKRVEKRLRDEAAARARTESVREAEAARTQQVAPTRVGGAPGGSASITGTKTADAAYNRGEITSAQLRGYYEQFGEPFPFD